MPPVDGAVPVVVVGAGPVGLTLALLLARRGVRSVILERHRDPYDRPRAVHLDGSALRVLEAAGVADRLVPLTRPMPGMRLVDRDRRPLATFARPDHRGWYAFPASSMVHQPDLDALLLGAVAAEPLVDLRRGCPVDAVEGTTVRHRIAATGDRRTLEAGWVVGCDGADSVVRRSIGSGLVDLGFEQRWLVVDGRSAAPLDVWPGVHQVCDGARPSTFMHVVGDRYRWELRLAPGEEADALTAGLPALLQREARGVEVEVVRRAAYTFRACVADRWRSGRVLLAGDAAHQTPPFIGQGLSAGLLDAADLGWKLAASVGCAGLADLPDAWGVDLLDTYQAEREPHVRQVIRGAVLVGRLLPGQPTRRAEAAGAILRAGLRQPRVASLASRLSSPRLSSGPLVRRRRLDRLTGTWCPEPHPGADRRLGDGWCLISRGALDSPVHSIDVSGRVTPADRTLDEWLRSARVHAALLRPDHVVAATARSAGEAGGLVDRLPRG